MPYIIHKNRKKFNINILFLFLFYPACHYQTLLSKYISNFYCMCGVVLIELTDNFIVLIFKFQFFLNPARFLAYRF